MTGLTGKERVMAENKPCDIDVLADRIVELVKGIDDWGDAGCEVSRLLRDELPALWEWSSQELKIEEQQKEIERLRVHRDAWQEALYYIRKQCSEEASTGSRQAEFGRKICDNIRAKAFELLLDKKFKSTESL